MTEDDYRRDAAGKGYGEPMAKTWEPGLYNADHAHDVDLFLYILEGEVNFDIAGPDGMATNRRRAGETIEVPAGTAHTERIGDAGVRFLVARR